MKKILFVVAMVIFVACNNNSDTKNDRDTTPATGSDVSNSAPMQGDTTSYERMSNKVGSSHQH